MINQLYTEVFPNKNRVFFVEKGGLTSTEASHKANLITEKLRDLVAQFENTGAFESTMDFDGKSIRMDKNQTIPHLEALSLVEGDLHSLTSWLREGVVAKNIMLNSLRTLPLDKLFLKEEEGFPKFEDKAPMMEPVTPLIVVKEDDIIGRFTIKERAEYLALISRAAHLGKKIHKGGVIANIRKHLQRGILTSFEEKSNGLGMKTYVVEHKPLYDKEDIEKIYFKLQEQHRSYEAKLNYYKAMIADEVNTINAEALQVYNNEYKAKALAYQALQTDYSQKWQAHNSAVNQINTSLEKRRLELTQHVSGLKIVIPEELKEIVKYLEEKETETEKK